MSRIVSLLISNGLTQGLGLASLFVIGFVVPASALADIRILQSYTGLLVVLASLGTNAAILKVCSNSAQPELFSAAIKFGFNRMFYGTLLVIFALTLVVTNCESWSVEFKRQLCILALSVPFVATGSMGIVFLQATRRFQILVRCQNRMRVILFTGQVVAGVVYGVYGFVVATVCANAVALLVVRSAIPIDSADIWRAGAIANGVTRVANFALYGSLVSYFYQFLDIFILDKFSQDRSGVGAYAFASLLAQGAGLVGTTVQSYASPFFGGRELDHAWVSKNRRLLRMGMLGLSAAIGLCVTAISLVVPLAMGKEFDAVPVYTVCLMLRFILWSQCCMISGIFDAWGQTRLNFQIIAFSTPPLLVMMWVFVSAFGVGGAAYAQVLGAVITLLASEFAVYTHKQKAMQLWKNIG